MVKLLPIMQFSSSSCYFLTLRPKYLPQHSILEHLQYMFFPYCTVVRKITSEIP